MYTVDSNDKRNPSERAYDYLMGGESYRNPYLNYADAKTPAMPSTENIGDNHWEYDPLTKAWRLIAGKSAEATEAPKTVADVNEQYQKASGSSAPFGRDSEGNALSAPQDNLTPNARAMEVALRNQYGWNNEYDKGNAQNFGKAFLSMLGGPVAFGMTAAKMYADGRKKDLEGMDPTEYRIAEAALAADKQSGIVNLAPVENKDWGSGQGDAAGLAAALQEIRDREAQDSGTSGGSNSYATNSETAQRYGTNEGSQQTAMLAAQDSDMASGGAVAYAAGGLGSLGSYSDGGRLLRGPGDGVSDGIPAVIGKNQPAKLADGEFVLPARIVSELGNGSTEAGAKKLYAMMDRIEKAQRNAKRGKDSKADKYLPA
jgi:hypothetical protein